MPVRPRRHLHPSHQQAKPSLTLLLVTVCGRAVQERAGCKCFRSSTGTSTGLWRLLLLGHSIPISCCSLFLQA